MVGFVVERRALYRPRQLNKTTGGSEEKIGEAQKKGAQPEVRARVCTRGARRARAGEAKGDVSRPAFASRQCVGRGSSASPKKRGVQRSA